MNPLAPYCRFCLCLSKHTRAMDSVRALLVTGNNMHRQQATSRIPMPNAPFHAGAGAQG